MADKAVERVEPPYPDHWDSQVKGDDTAYVMVYTHVDDSIESVAFNKTGAEIKRMAGDFRRPATRGTAEAVGRARPAAEVIPGVPAAGHEPLSAREVPLASKTLPEHDPKANRPKP
jgi:hypothetical protein